MNERPVVVVTGGGGGIGAAVAEELGRTGWHVVTVDPLVSVDGSEPLPAPEETTAGRIVAAGGSARASGTSVTDAEAVRELFGALVAEHGRLDAVINVAGISRPTSYTSGTDEAWRSVLSVHLDGYLNVLAAALPIMAAAGHGRILGVTSGSGWRQADTGAYGSAKRAVAALTWQLGRQAPDGVVVNAMSPIAMTRMVTAAIAAARPAPPTSEPGGGGAAKPASTPPGSRSGGGGSATGGLSLGSMPAPEELGPIGAHLVGDRFAAWCRGEVIFVGGSEVAVVEPPRLLESVRTDGVASLPRLLEAVTAGALARAEATQASGGGRNPRFGAALAPSPVGDLPPAAIRTCAVVSDRPELVAALTAALGTRSVACTTVDPTAVSGFAGCAAALASAADGAPLDAVVVALAGAEPSTVAGSGWEQVLQEHTGLVDQLHLDAAWSRAVADMAAATGRPNRLVTLTDATTAGGRSRAQSSAHHARSARSATDDRVSAFAVSVESSSPAALAELGEVAAHLLCSPEAAALAGAELVTGAGWFGLRSHPRPIGSVTFGGPAVPAWLDDALRDATR